VGIGYGLPSQSIFRMPYPLQRSLYGGGSDVDPVAALVGNALGSFQGVRNARQQEADRQQALKRQDTATANENQYRNADLTTRLLAAGYAPGASPSALGPDAGNSLSTGPTTGAVGAPSTPPVSMDTLRSDRLPVGQPAAPSAASSDLTIPGLGPFHRVGLSTADQKAADTDARLRTVHQRVGHVLAQQLFGHDVDDDTAEGLGTNPQAFVGLANHEPRNIDPLSPAGIAARARLAQIEASEKTTPAMAEHAEYGAGALAAWQQFNKIRQQNPNVETEVGGIMASPAFVQAIPGVRSSADMVSLLKRAGASPAAQNYMRAKWSFLDNVIRTRQPGGRMSGALFQQVQNEFMPSLDAQANGQLRTNELNAIVSAQGLAGYDVNPDVWNRATKRHGVGNLDVSALMSGGTGDPRLDAIRRKY